MSRSKPGPPTHRWAALAALVGDLRSVWTSSVAAPLDFALRLWLAHGFIISGALKASDWDTALQLASYEYPVSWMAPAQAAALGLGIELIAGSLLLLGLATRPAALALAALTWVVQFEYLALNAHWYSAILLLWYAIAGARGLSFDHLLGKGLGDSALPGGQGLHHMYDWLTRHLVPLSTALLRLGLAAIVLGALGVIDHGLSASSFDPSPLSSLLRRSQWVDMGDGELLRTLASFGFAEQSLLALLALLIASGLLTRLSCVGALLLLGAELAQSPASPLQMADVRGLASWLLVLLVAGPGSLALDAPLLGWLRRQRPPAANSSEAQQLPHVVVVGAGFGGLACVRALRHSACRITLIDQHNYHLFQPLLYQIATAGLSPADIATPVRELLRNQPNVLVRMGRVSAINKAQRELQLQDQCIAYDYLVLATGARHSYFGKDGWEPYAPGLKRVEDAIEVRRRLLLGFEMAENASDPREREAWMKFVIVGGGPTGVELAGAIAELARHGMTDEFSEIDPAQARVMLVQSADRLLPSFPAALSKATQASLEALGINVVLNSKVEHIDGDGVTVNGERIAARTVLWAAGVAASPAAEWLDCERDRAGRVVVGPHLEVPGHADIFAIGDTAASTAWNGQPVPGLAPAAKQGGQHVARVIRNRLIAKPMPAAFRYRHYGSLATIGRKSAVADFGRLRLSGPIAWWFWGVVHVMFLASLRNRAAVASEWIWAYLTFRRSTRLITGGATQADAGAGDPGT